MFGYLDQAETNGGSCVRTGRGRPTDVPTKREPLTDALESYMAFDQRKPGWIKVKLVLSA